MELEVLEAARKHEDIWQLVEVNVLEYEVTRTN